MEVGFTVSSVAELLVLGASAISILIPTRKRQLLILEDVGRVESW